VTVIMQENAMISPVVQPPTRDSDESDPKGSKSLIKRGAPIRASTKYTVGIGAEKSRPLSPGSDSTRP
jgi:hypothetical protein